MMVLIVGCWKAFNHSKDGEKNRRGDSREDGLLFLNGKR